MTDVHTHLLPGVDDGASSEEEALQLLRYLASIGVERIYLTPHVMQDLEKNTAEYLTDSFLSFRALSPEGIELRLAAEYMIDSDFQKHIDAGLLTMANRFVLIETSYLSAPFGFNQFVYELMVNGYIPILAHPERYFYMGVNDYRLLKEQGCRFQLNLMSLHGTYGRRAALVSHQLLKEGFYDYVGSDLHRLEVYCDVVEHLSLTRTQQQNLKTLLENNHSLW